MLGQKYMERARLGRYELVSHLATGGMGRVSLARAQGESGFERHVVIKSLDLVDVDDTEATAMFLDEARLLGMLHHQHVAAILEVGRDEDGRLFLVLEYVHGHNAHDVWERALDSSYQLPLDFALTVVAGAASGLHYAHTKRSADGNRLKLVHRDVTLSNLMVGFDGAVKVIDFGIAKAAIRTTRTQTGFIKGKLGYMAPEQLRGRAVDARTDVFSLGIVLYELTTMRRAFRDVSDRATVQRIKAGSYLRPTEIVPDYPPELEAIVARALDIEPEAVRLRGRDAPCGRGAGPQAPPADRRCRRHPCHDGAVSGPGRPVATSRDHARGDRGDDRGRVGSARRTDRGRDQRHARLAARLTGGPDWCAAETREHRGRRAARDRQRGGQRHVHRHRLADRARARGQRSGRSEPRDHRVVRRADHPDRAAGCAEAADRRAVDPGARHRPAGRDHSVRPHAPRRGRWWLVGVAALVAIAVPIAVLAWRDDEPAAPPVETPRARAVAPAPVPPRRPAPPPVEPPPVPTVATPAKGRLRVTSIPSDATVLLDGRRLGRTPIERPLAIAPGTHVIKLRRRGYAPQKRTIELAPGASIDEAFKLARIVPGVADN